MAGSKPAYLKRRLRGFEKTSTLVASRIRKCGESRGFAVSRLLTHWPEVVGTDIAALTRPIEVTYGRSGTGAVLTVLTTGAQAPILEMQVEKICDKVNACYGYAAISRIRLTQTAPVGFAEGRADFSHQKDIRKKPATQSPEIAEKAAETASDIADPGLRAALEKLGGHVLAPRK